MKFQIYILGFLLLFAHVLSAQISVQIAGTNVSCFGGSNGSAIATATGGSLPYSFIWSTGGTNNTVANLSIGTYSVTVTDNTGNTGTKSVVITQPPLLGATLNGQPQICVVAPDGFSYAIPTGGTPPYSYSWSNGVQTQLNNHLTANNYAVTITDTKGCTTIRSFTVGFLGIGLYLVTNTNPATCPEPDNGAASVTALSGNGPYQYQWNSGATTKAIENITAGNYVVTVSDMNGCSATNSVTVVQENLDTVNIDVPDPQCTQVIYDFESQGNYQVYSWKLSDPIDSIIGRDDTPQIQVKWRVQGQKQLSVSMLDTLTGCSTGMAFNVTVYACISNTSTLSLASIEAVPNPFDHYINLQGSL
jgi:SprB repeat